MEPTETTEEPRVPFRQLVRNFLIEMAVYGLLLVAYFYVALIFLGEPLAKLYQENLTLYALIALTLMVVQAVFLEFITSFLFDFLGLHRLTSSPPKH